ncbi:MAG: winged helix-turn-helix domain-containing protein [Chitinophagales bacterium]|nr:winged helix-turn-helix domain-containing protein [Chitinophagales bacterium]
MLYGQEKQSVNWLKEFGIVISISAMGVYLRKVLPQKPKKQAYEQCPRKSKNGWMSNIHYKKQ